MKFIVTMNIVQKIGLVLEGIFDSFLTSGVVIIMYSVIAYALFSIGIFQTAEAAKLSIVILTLPTIFVSMIGHVMLNIPERFR